MSLHRSTHVIGVISILSTLALILLFVVVLIVGNSKAATTNLPQRNLTPGWYNPFVNQGNINSTICVSGYTATIRPAYSYTSNLKKLELRYRRMPGTVSDYELDHFIPLELGGNPYDTRNLWMEAWSNAHKSDPYENQLHRQVCNGGLTLRQAREDIIAFKRAHG